MSSPAIITTATPTVLQTLQASPSYAQSWGIYVAGTGGGTPLYKPTSAYTTISTLSVGQRRQMETLSFPVEAPSPASSSPNNGTVTNPASAFASYNKVWQPATPTVTLGVSGQLVDLAGFLAALEAACLSTNLYDVFAGDDIFVGYSIDSYSYHRRAANGATMLFVEIGLTEVLQVSAAYSSPSSPQSPSAVPSVNNGLVTPSEWTTGSGLINFLGGSN